MLDLNAVELCYLVSYRDHHTCLIRYLTNLLVEGAVPYETKLSTTLALA